MIIDNKQQGFNEKCQAGFLSWLTWLVLADYPVSPWESNDSGLPGMMVFS